MRADRFILWWFGTMTVVLVAVTVTAIVVATLAGHWEPLLGTATAAVLFGPPLLVMVRSDRD